MEKPLFVTVPLSDFRIGEKLPVKVYIYVEYQFVVYREVGAALDSATYERFLLKKIDHLFIREEDRPAFQKWLSDYNKENSQALEIAKKSPDYEVMKNLRDNLDRKAMDIFQVDHPNKMISAAINASKDLVDSFMNIPYAVKPLLLLQTSSQGVANHSVNVATLSVYLANQIGYTHQLILQHLGMGALLHDIGKMLVKFSEQDTMEEFEEKLKKHPELGIQLIEKMGEQIPKEVKMIVSQHHEFMDGTGYPNKFRGNSIYDLARIVCIANVFDQLVSNGTGPVHLRQYAAIEKMEKEMSEKFDKIKFEKIMKILKMGI